MKIDVIAVGKLKAGPERELVARYSERFRAIGRSLGLDGPRLVEISESQARRDLDRKAEEGAALLAAAPDGSKLIMLDEHAPLIESAAFAAQIRQWQDAGIPVAGFLIGGADGHGDAVAKRADLGVCFGRMTLPHQLVRVLVLEQLYRAATILAGHPYHRV